MSRASMLRTPDRVGRNLSPDHVQKSQRNLRSRWSGSLPRYRWKTRIFSLYRSNSLTKCRCRWTMLSKNSLLREQSGWTETDMLRTSPHWWSRRPIGTLLVTITSLGLPKTSTIGHYRPLPNTSKSKAARANSNLLRCK